MNEVGYRFEQRHKWSLMAGSFVFGALILFCTFAAVVEDPRFMLASLFWLVPLAGCQIALRDIKRGHLFFGPDHVTQLGWRDGMIPIHSVSLVKWRPITRRVKLYSPRGKLTIQLDKFEFPDRVKIVHELRTRCARARHLDWPRFCHQYAVKSVDELSEPPPDPRPNREPADGEYFMSRRRFGAEWAVVSGICSLGWLAFITLTTTNSGLPSELLATRELAMQSAAFAVVPILALWIGWCFLVWRYPKEGRLRKKEGRDEQDRRNIKRVKKFGISVLLFGAIWTFASYYAFESVFGFSQDIAGVLSMLTLLALVVGISAVGGFLLEEEIQQADFEPALKRWEQYEQAQQKVRRPRIPGRRKNDPFIIR